MRTRGTLNLYLLSVIALAASPGVFGTPAPASDPDNTGGWVLNTEISDEFDGEEIDRSKWLVQGDNGDYYIWKGRAPSQFAPHNVIVADGTLKLRTQWEPDFAFAEESYADGPNNDPYGTLDGKPMPVTTAAIISRKRFLHGYMEVRSKAGDAAMTSSFWAIGFQQELDIYEQMGKPKKPGSIREDYLKTTIHDWSPPAIRPTRAFGYSQRLPFRVADDFHIYAAEWGPDYLKIYVDGEMVHHVTREHLGLDWVLNNPMEIWLDSEIFKWLGLPHKEELPVDFEVDYVRVWQKPSENLLQEHGAFYGFEGPMLFQDTPIPLDLVPENAGNNAYQKFWIIDEASSKSFRITHKRWFSGVESLKYVSISGQPDVQVESPKGGVNLPPGEYELSMKILLKHGNQPQHLRVTLRSPEVVIPPFELNDYPRGKWITIRQTFAKPTASSPDDQIRLAVLAQDLEQGAGDFFIDDIEIRAVD